MFIIFIIIKLVNNNDIHNIHNIHTIHNINQYCYCCGSPPPSSGHGREASADCGAERGRSAAARTTLFGLPVAVKLLVDL